MADDPENLPLWLERLVDIVQIHNCRQGYCLRIKKKKISTTPKETGEGQKDKQKEVKETVEEEKVQGVKTQGWPQKSL